MMRNIPRSEQYGWPEAKWRKLKSIAAGLFMEESWAVFAVFVKAWRIDPLQWRVRNEECRMFSGRRALKMANRKWPMAKLAGKAFSPSSMESAECRVSAAGASTSLGRCEDRASGQRR